jgi:exonuclease III
LLRDEPRVQRGGLRPRPIPGLSDTLACSGPPSRSYAAPDHGTTRPRSASPRLTAQHTGESPMLCMVEEPDRPCPTGAGRPAMNHAGLPTLRILSHNVNGMRGAVRRRVFFGTLIDEGYDIVALQETHQAATEPQGPPAEGADAEDGDRQGDRISEGDEWAREGAGPTRPWPGTAFWAPGVLGQRGVALLFSERAVHELGPTLLTADPEGRYISVTCTFDGQPFTVTSVYAPCTAEERSVFFTEALLPQLDPSHTHLAGGDFNCIADPFRDQTLPPPPPLPGGAAQPPPPQRRCEGYVGGLQAVEDALGLVDCWRELHPDETAGGYTHGRLGSMARLDRWLASPFASASLRSKDQAFPSGRSNPMTRQGEGPRTSAIISRKARRVAHPAEPISMAV